MPLTYPEALAYLRTLPDHSLVAYLTYSPEKFDLSRITELLARLKQPQYQYPVLHVAGTKGKGSICAMLTSALTAAGYRVGLYTSPAVFGFTEQIQINHLPIPPETLAALVEELQPRAAQVEGLTAFEFITALAFHYFARQAVEVAVIETGVGGRVDATNSVQPLVAIIASISLDHTQLLGETVEQIAHEKAGIIKFKRPVVSAPQRLEARQVIEHTAHIQEAPLTMVEDAYGYELVERDLRQQTFRVWERGSTTPPLTLKIPLRGRHQIENAVTAYAALRVGQQAGLNFTNAQLQEGFARVTWPGRFEIVSTQPVIVLDGAHNRDSARRLREALQDYAVLLPIVLVFGAAQDKDVRGMFEELLPLTRHLLTVQARHPRAAEAEALAEVAHSLGATPQALPSVAAALELARVNWPEMTIVVTGSLFVVAEAREERREEG